MKRFIAIFVGIGLSLCFGPLGCQTQRYRVEAESRPDEGPKLTSRAAAFAHYSSGIIRALDGDLAAASEEFFRAAQLDRTDADLLADVAKRLIEQRQFQLAREVLQWATKLPDTDADLFLQLGFVCSQLGQHRKAITANRQAIQRQPQSLPAWNNLYLNYGQLGQPEKALFTLDEARAQSEVPPEYHLKLAMLYLDCGERFPKQREVARARALALLEQVKTANSLSGLQQIQLADGFNQLGAVDEATRLYLTALDQVTPVAALRELLRTKLAEIYLRQQDQEHALEQLNALVQDNPANAGAQYLLGSLALGQKRWDDAIRRFQLALQINPDFEAARLDLTMARLAAGQTEAALEDLREQRQRNPKSFTLEYLTGMAYQARQQYSQALEHFQAAEVLGLAGATNRLNANFYFQLGAAQERTGARQAAARSFEKSLALAPDNAEVMNYLGYMWAEHGENLKRARVLIERALKLEPDNDAFLDSMGWVLFKQGDVKGALHYLQEAVAKSEQPDPTLYDHLGDVYAALKELNHAREAWAKSLELEPNEAIQKKLNAVAPTP